MYHNFFIQSSACGDLGCFHALASINSASVNTGVDVSFSLMVFSGCMHSCGLSGHMVVFSMVNNVEIP